MITRLRAFAAFWYDFIVGDDWRVAVGVLVALAITREVALGHTLPAWWITMVAVAVVLPLSVYRETRRRPYRHRENTAGEG